MTESKLSIEVLKVKGKNSKKNANNVREYVSVVELVINTT